MYTTFAVSIPMCSVNLFSFLVFLLMVTNFIIQRFIGCKETKVMKQTQAQDVKASLNQR